MKKTGKLIAAVAGAVALTAMLDTSAFADSRHQNETWRHDQHDRYDRDDRYGRNDRNDRNDRHDTLRGVIQRVDVRRGVAVVRERSSGRRVVVHVDYRTRGRGQRRDRGLDLEDLRRGDYVTFRGDWERGYFDAYRIDHIRSGRY